MDDAFLNHTWKGVLCVGSLLFNAGIILFCLLKGEPANSLHSSALAWAFMLAGATLGGLGIASLTPTVLDAFKPKTS